MSNQAVYTFIQIPTCSNPFYPTGQYSALPAVLTPAGFPSHAGRSASPDPTEDPHAEVSQWTHGADEASTESTTKTKATVHSEAATKAARGTQTPAVTSPRTNVPAAMTSPSGIQDKPCTHCLCAASL